MLKAGISRRDISPKPGEELAGYPHYPRNNTGVHDPLYATCMYIENASTCVALITLDLLFFSKKHVLKVRELVSEKAGIPGECISIGCSHTHSGPWASGRLDIESLEAGKQETTEYIDYLVSQITDAICEAKATAFKAEFASNTVLCGAEQNIGGNRRMKGGPHDPLVSVLAIRDDKKQIRGTIVNYSLHPTLIHEWSNVVTADYPGYVRICIEASLPGTIAGFIQGASGNQSTRYYREGESFDEAERIGNTLGKAALKAIETADWQDNLEIEVTFDTIPVELRSFGDEKELEKKVEEDTKRYKELYALYGDSKNRDEYYLWQNANLKMLGSEDQLGYVKLQNRGISISLKDDEQPAELMAIRLGDTLILACPGEVFIEYALFLKAMSPYRVTVFNELSNGCLPGYVYTPESLVSGGYETDTSMLSESFGMNMTMKMLDMIKI